MASLLNVGRALVEKGPYDAEIEYLESSGTQYIDTGIVPPETYYSVSITVDAQFTDISRRQLFGASNAFYLGVNSGRWEGHYATYINGADTYRHIFTKELRKPNQHTFYMDGVGSYKTSVVSQANYKFSAYLFAMNENDTPYNFVKCRLYGAKMYIDDVLVYDSIPVRVGTIGYMYDKVSGQLFGNQGTGDFILGPDK